VSEAVSASSGAAPEDDVAAAVARMDAFLRKTWEGLGCEDHEGGAYETGGLEAKGPNAHLVWRHGALDTDELDLAEQ